MSNPDDVSNIEECFHCGGDIYKVMGKYVHDRGTGYKSVRCPVNMTVATPRPKKRGALGELLGFTAEDRFILALKESGEPAWVETMTRLFREAVAERREVNLQASAVSAVTR